MAKLTRESRLRERRAAKAVRKDLRKQGLLGGDPDPMMDDLTAPDDATTDASLAGDHDVADGEDLSPGESDADLDAPQAVDATVGVAD